MNQTDVPPAWAFSPPTIGWQRINDRPVFGILRAQDDSSLLEIQGEVTGEVEATSEPSAGRDIELGTAVISEGTERKDGSMECVGVEEEAITDGTKIGEGSNVGTSRQETAMEATVRGWEVGSLGGLESYGGMRR